MRGRRAAETLQGRPYYAVRSKTPLTSPMPLVSIIPRGETNSSVVAAARARGVAVTQNTRVCAVWCIMLRSWSACVCVGKRSQIRSCGHRTTYCTPTCSITRKAAAPVAQRRWFRRYQDRLLRLLGARVVAAVEPINRTINSIVTFLRLPSHPPPARRLFRRKWSKARQVYARRQNHLLRGGIRVGGRIER